jgi:hypothetical protein
VGSSYQIFFNGQAATSDFYNAIATLEVEENMDLPGAVQISLPVSRTQSGDLSYVSDSTLQPMVNVAVVVNPPKGGAAGAAAPAVGALTGVRSNISQWGARSGSAGRGASILSLTNDRMYGWRWAAVKQIAPCKSALLAYWILVRI